VAITAELSSKQINRAKAMPREFRNIAEGYEDMGSDATAKDYREAADMIEQLLAVLGVPVFRD
jgi:hypothetical protein